MKIRNISISKRTLALAAATVLVLCSGSFVGTRAALTYFSDDYIGAFELDHLQVHLLENGTDVCLENNDDDTVHGTYTNKEKYHGNLLEYLGYQNKDSHYGDTAVYKLDGTSLGTVEPGRTYQEEISAENGRDIDQYVRLTVKKYWVNTETGKKDTRLSPDLIRLTYGDKDFNSGSWQINPGEHTPESDTYYLTKILGGNKTSDLLFDSLTIDKSVADEEHMTVTTEKKTEGNKTTYVSSYTYDYNGYAFYIEANVQAIQTHNIQDAIDSLWGVENVSAAGGSITVK